MSIHNQLFPILITAQEVYSNKLYQKQLVGPIMDMANQTTPKYNCLFHSKHCICQNEFCNHDI